MRSLHVTRKLIALICCMLAAAASASDGATTVGPEQRDYETVVSKAIGFLKTKGRSPDVSYSSQTGPGVTALVATALMRQGVSPDDPLVSRSLKYLESTVQPTGGIHAPKSMYMNYETCLAVMCFSEANRDGRYAKTFKGADRFLKRLQWDEDEGHKEDSFFHGGGGYGKHRRPDLSNTSFLVEALRSCGNTDNDPGSRELDELPRISN